MAQCERLEVKVVDPSASHGGIFWYRWDAEGKFVRVWHRNSLFACFEAPTLVDALAVVAKQSKRQKKVGTSSWLMNLLIPKEPNE